MIKAEGKFPAWPVEIVCDRDEVTIEAATESGELAVAIPAGSAPGVAWVRMHDKTSASKLVPLLIEPIKPLTETEPNNEIAAAATVGLPNVLAGRLEKSGDVDSFRIAVRSGQALVVSATAHRVLQSPMDAVLQLVDLQGNVIVQSDDVRGIDPQIVYQVKDDAELLVRIFAFPETPNSTIGFAGAASFVYMLRVTTDAFLDHALPLVIGSDTAASTPFGWNLPPGANVKHYSATSTSPAVAYLPGCFGWQWQVVASKDAVSLVESEQAAEPTVANRLPCIFSGHIGRPGEIDRVRVEVEKGKKYRASVQSREFGFAIDSVLRFVDAKAGTELARNDDRSRDQYDATVEYSPKEAGEVELQISDLVDAFGPRHAYSVLIEESKPSFALSLAEDHYAVRAGESVEIAVSVSRLQGFQAKLKISAEGLPEGIQAEPIESDTKGGSAKSVKLKLTATKDAAAYQGVFTILGTVLDSDGMPTGDSSTAFHQLRDVVRLKEVWLAVAAAKP